MSAKNDAYANFFGFLDHFVYARYYFKHVVYAGAKK